MNEKFTKLVSELIMIIDKEVEYNKLDLVYDVLSLYEGRENYIHYLIVREKGTNFVTKNISNFEYVKSVFDIFRDIKFIIEISNCEITNKYSKEDFIKNKLNKENFI